VLIFDISAVQSTQLLANITSAATRRKGGPNFQLAISIHSLIIACAQPDIIEEYSLSDLTDIVLRKTYTLYNLYTLFSPITFDFSDYSNMFYIAATLNSNNQTVILAFKAGAPINQVLHSVIYTNTTISNQTQFILQASGYGADVVIYTNPTTWGAVRSFQNPVLYITNPMNSYNFSIIYTGMDSS